MILGCKERMKKKVDARGMCGERGVDAQYFLATSSNERTRPGIKNKLENLPILRKAPTNNKCFYKLFNRKRYRFNKIVVQRISH